MSEFYEGLAEILEVDLDQITPDLALEDGSWDSLAVVSTIALIDDVPTVAELVQRLQQQYRAACEVPVWPAGPGDAP